MNINEKAIALVKDAAGFNDPEQTIDEQEGRIPLYIWMHRNNIERTKINEILDTLIDNKSLEAAKAVIVLKLGVSEDDTRSMLGRVADATTKR
ncbi:MAG TPA: hypothetical protein PLZ43_07295 [bacterium]|nr:hypothetical protein [bacterium]